jgi:hypothetical protein
MRVGSDRGASATVDRIAQLWHSQHGLAEHKYMRQNIEQSRPLFLACCNFRCSAEEMGLKPPQTLAIEPNATIGHPLVMTSSVMVMPQVFGHAVLLC